MFGLWKRAPVALTPGEEVEVAFADAVGRAHAFITTVLEQERRHIGLFLPRDPSALIKSLKVTVHFIREGSLGSFQGQVTKIETDGRFPHFTVTAPTLVHWQRIDPYHMPLREFPAAELSFPGEITFENEKIDCITCEIGGNNIVLLTPRAIPEDSEIAIRLSLPGREIDLEGKVISSSRYKGKLPKGSHLKFETILNFLDISLEEQDYILYLVMEKSREIPLPSLASPPEPAPVDEPSTQTPPDD